MKSSSSTDGVGGTPPPEVLETDGWSRRLEHLDADDLRALALTLPVLEQAKGVLMGHYGCDATTAFAILRRMSSVRHTKLRDVAQALVTSVTYSDGADSHDGSTFDGISRFLRAMGDGLPPAG